MKIDENKDNQSLELSDGLRKSSINIKNSEEEQKKKVKKKKKFQSFAKLPLPKRVRTSSMSSLTPIQEQIKKVSKVQNVLFPNNVQVQRRKSKVIQGNDINDKQFDKVPSPERQMNNENKKQELIRKMKFLSIAQPRNKEVQSLIDELRTYIQNTQSNNQSLKVDNELNNNAQSDVDSQFSIDHMANYESFFQEENPEKVIRKYKRIFKERVKLRRTTLIRYQDD